MIRTTTFESLDAEGEMIQIALEEAMVRLAISVTGYKYARVTQSVADNIPRLQQRVDRLRRERKAWKLRMQTYREEMMMSKLSP